MNHLESTNPSFEQVFENVVVNDEAVGIRNEFMEKNPDKAFYHIYFILIQMVRCIDCQWLMLY